jgi:ribosomal protein S4
MAKKEKPIVDNDTGKIKVKAKKEKQPSGNETKGDVTKVKEKMKMKPVVEEESITKVELNKKEEIKEDTPVEAETKVEEQKPVEEEKESTPALEEITEEAKEEVVESTPEEVIEAVKEAEATGQPLPENIQKLMNFMDETGGDLSDYVKLNKDYSKLDDRNLLHEYYTQTKPHLNNEEINFLMEDQFSYDEDVDEDRDIQRKKLALKEQVANAKSHLDGQKSKYYEDIKAGSKLTSEQQKAIDFFNRYNKESQENEAKAKAQRSTFEDKTNGLFNDKFKGFEYKVGDKRFRFNVKDVDSIKEAQSDSDNFFKKFLDKNNHLKDAQEFHKSLYTASNADAIASHFYEQGKADAMKNSMETSKNVDMTPRQSHGEIEAGGIKVKVLGEDSNDFKFKIRNKNK